MDFFLESEHVSEEEFEVLFEDLLVLFLELELLHERFLLVLFFLGCLFLVLGAALLLRLLEGLE